MGFSTCYCPIEANVRLEVTLICKSDLERKHALKYVIREYCPQFPSAMYFIYIPFQTLWRGASQGKTPNDYYLFEVSSFYEEELWWGIGLEFENKVWR